MGYPCRPAARLAGGPAGTRPSVPARGKPSPALPGDPAWPHGRSATGDAGPRGQAGRGQPNPTPAEPSAEKGGGGHCCQQLPPLPDPKGRALPPRLLGQGKHGMGPGPCRPVWVLEPFCWQGEFQPPGHSWRELGSTLAPATSLPFPMIEAAAGQGLRARPWHIPRQDRHRQGQGTWGPARHSAVTPGWLRPCHQPRQGTAGCSPAQPRLGGTRGLERGAGPGCPGCSRGLGDTLSPGEGGRPQVPRGPAEAHRAPSAPPPPP